jgi:2-succinyl-6-hydroxy-2,4-cyclohexadiene-1-carboxylate synthase
MTAALSTRVTGSGPALVLAHGFTQTGRVWGTLDALLARDHRVVAADMPGHAGSTAVTASLPEGAELLGALGGRASYLGYSMGARFCLHLALSRPDLVDALVLISGTAGIDDPDERLERRRSDEAMADQLDPRRGPGSAAIPVETFLRQWMESPMFSGIGPEAAGMEERLRNTGPGLASSLSLAGTGTQVPRWSELDRLAMPVLVITGEGDAKFSGLGRRLVDAIGPNATQVVVAGTGHAPHLERPGEVAAAVRAHLSRVGPA